jgi:hypothetical protein
LLQYSYEGFRFAIFSIIPLFISYFSSIFFSGEGHRSRRYGCTAALRLLVHPCDEDETMIIFVHFLVMEHQWNEIDRGKPKYSGKNLSQCHFVHHKSHMD